MKRRGKIIIVDYGVGNLYSLAKAIKQFTEDVDITDDPNEIAHARALVLPGVGSFESGINGLKVRGLIGAIKNFAKAGKPILGICLGAQLMLSKGYEFGEFEGLNFIPGKVVQFPKLKQGFKVPHIGWNTVKLDNNAKQGKIFKSLNKPPYFYFVHSYVMEPDKKENIIAETNYGGHIFCSIIKKGNIYGCQFHPEKSGKDGLQLIKNFVFL